MYDSDNESPVSDEEPLYVPDLEFVEVDHQVSPQEGNAVHTFSTEDITVDQGDASEDEEFAFPLFAGASDAKDAVMTVTLKEREEIIVNERPESYYRASYSIQQLLQFQDAAITFEHILIESRAPPVDSCPLRVMNLEEHNARVALEKLRRRREGKKKRLNKEASRERRLAREKEKKRKEREEKRSFYRGKTPVRKPKYSAKKQVTKAVEKPKYRTE